MTVERVELRIVRVRLSLPFETSFGRTQEELKVLVRLDSDGETGWGEAPAGAFPGYSAETAWTAMHVAEKFLAPRILGVPLDSPDAFARRFDLVRGHPMAKAGLEFAFWDLLGRTAGRSVREMLGGVRTAVPAGISLGLQASDEALVDRVRESAARGYRRVKVKIKPGRDVSMLAAVRKALPELALMADANAAYSLADADTLGALDAYGLTMLEQPLAVGDLLDHALLAKRLRTPICLDESIGDRRAARQALELGACRILNVKPARVGGLVEARAIHDEALARSAPVWCGGLLESGIGRAVNVTLASLPGFTLPGDLSETARYWPEADELFHPPFVLSPDGTLPVPGGAGFGMSPKFEAIEHATVTRAEQRAGSPT